MSPEEWNSKLEEAIALGFINRHIGADGIVQYALTPTGLIQWLHEKQRSHGL